MPEVPGPGAQGDHCTAGLAGHPALDLVGTPGSPLYAEEGGTVRNVHVIPWRAGYGGLTFYLAGDSGADYFITHLDPARPVVHDGQRVNAGDVLGYLPPAESVQYIYVVHAHVGSSGYVYPSCNARGCSGESGCGSGKSPLELAGGATPPPSSGGPPSLGGGTGTAQPVGVFSTITGGIGDIFGGVFGRLWDWGKDAANALVSIAMSIVFLIHFVTNPDNWLRLIEFLFGIGLIAMALAIYLKVFTGRTEITPAKLPPIPVE